LQYKNIMPTRWGEKLFFFVEKNFVGVIVRQEEREMSRSHKKNRKVLDYVARQSGLRREEHFAMGGTVEEWRGRHSVQVDKKKEKSRKACRKPVDH
jgi:hypothetical protein